MRRLHLSLLSLLLVWPCLVPAQQDAPVDDEPAAATEAGTDEWGDDWDDTWDEDGEDWADDDAWTTGQAPAWTGFIEGAAGSRWEEDPAVGRYATLGETRLRLERSWSIPGRLANNRLDLRADAWADAVLEEFDGAFRELAWGFSAGSWDLRAGRQVLTWGTGDLLFLNDLFPKGWVSFFIGRDDEYLKVPSDAFRATGYFDAVNIDVVAVPRFTPDEWLTGERLSFFSPAAGRIVAPKPPLSATEPSASLDNTEWALRLFRNFGGDELALYAYDGFYHQPSPTGPDGALRYPALGAIGASWRRPMGPGLFNAEVSRYASRDDRDGTDPRIPNDQARILLGYEWEAVRNLTVGFQYYLEWTLDYDALLANSPWPQYEVDERRTWLTNRLTWRTRQDRLVWSLFTFYSPTDRDHYLRPQVEWRISDAWQFNAGGNLFDGPREDTFFGQFEHDSNVYARIRFNY